MNITRTKAALIALALATAFAPTDRAAAHTVSGSSIYSATDYLTNRSDGLNLTEGAIRALRAPTTIDAPSITDSQGAETDNQRSVNSGAAESSSLGRRLSDQPRAELSFSRSRPRRAAPLPVILNRMVASYVEAYLRHFEGLRSCLE